MASLTSPLRIGALDLQHRVVLAPLTRNRAHADGVPSGLAREYYAQRASIPGTLLISEGTFITARAGGTAHVPGIWSPAQIQQWKTITSAVHQRGSHIFCQLWALGRAANPAILAQTGDEVTSSGNIPLTNTPTTVPRPLAEAEILDWIQDDVHAAQNAIAAGFDGVEIHGANGYLPDQFLQDTANNRTDHWGGSFENRSRFGLEVAKAVSAAIGSSRTGYRVSPWSTFQDMRMHNFRQQFRDLVERLAPLNLAYLHVVGPRISGGQTIEDTSSAAQDEMLDDTFLFDAFGSSGAIILAGGFTAESAQERLQRYPVDRPVAIAFGRHFLANPDLPFRLAKGLPLNQYDRSTFYTPESAVGYVDYPFSPDLVVPV
ncbi:12-oxophytodienoate reductase [Aspergillus ellipticus CBS 707.79]|uniref:12-oxophytodienoate reductase n=1 Tax=Aspergillus ellipticus CBS 707.79 TaxID=1448320 RepID=A0A319DDC0_9EURO|nr:12-oxophytodienoate reductase [Aspergillus ellipticus CBS 707.79]